MGNKASAPAPAVPAAAAPSSQQKVGVKSGKKICCCCPETKKARDECVVFKGEGTSDSFALPLVRTFMHGVQRGFAFINTQILVDARSVGKYPMVHVMKWIAAYTYVCA
mmetsp:Transcript_36768/g.74899  ORF Transcript_36768/g.74899 Transcript_36768/m.74899 type:complete len:109 (+) Transcript_36768:198-524(+)